MREYHVQFCESLRGKFPWATYLVASFALRGDADRFLLEIQKRFERFKLKLHPEKTKLIEYGKVDEVDSKPGPSATDRTFTFLGFTHFMKKRPKRGWKVARKESGQICLDPCTKVETKA